jgi:hypothetical protein
LTFPWTSTTPWLCGRKFNRLANEGIIVVVFFFFFFFPLCRAAREFELGVFFFQLGRAAREFELRFFLTIRNFRSVRIKLKAHAELIEKVWVDILIHVFLPGIWCALR